MNVSIAKFESLADYNDLVCHQQLLTEKREKLESKIQSHINCTGGLGWEMYGVFLLREK